VVGGMRMQRGVKVPAWVTFPFASLWLDGIALLPTLVGLVHWLVTLLSLDFWVVGELFD